MSKKEGATGGLEIFSKSVKLHLKSQASVEKTIENVIITIRMDGGGLKSNCLELELTRDSDPLFLYILSLDQEDFLNLKSDQTLLVDFASFPGKIVELLDCCIENQTLSYPKFVAQLIQDSCSSIWVFSIVETNSFKHITHLSLKFIPGNDLTTKIHLAGVVKNLKELLSSSNAQLHDTKQAQALAQRTLEHGRIEMDSLKQENLNDRNALVLKHTELLAKERELVAETLEKCRKQGEHQEKSLQTFYESQNKEIADQLVALQAVHQETKNTLFQTQGHFEKANSQLVQLNIQSSSFEKENSELKKQKGNLEKMVASLEGVVSDTKTKLSDLEKAAAEAREANLKIQDKFDYITAQMKKDQENTYLIKAEAERLMHELKNAVAEVTKANDIILKLKTEVKSGKSKLKLKNVVTIQQEKLLEEKNALYDALVKEAAALRAQIDKHIEENQAQVKKVATLTASLEETKKMIDDNNHVIDWLHKQLNEDALNRPSVKPFSTIDFNKYNGTARPESRFNNENSRIGDYGRTRFTSIESAGGFERASPGPPPTLPLGVSRAPSAFSGGNNPLRNKSPSAFQHFTVSNGPAFSKASVAEPQKPKSNYF